MKNKYPGLLIVAMIIPLISGCNDNQNTESVLSLYRESNFYSDINNQSITLPLATYHHKDEGNVPYVSLKEFLPVMKSVEKATSGNEPEVDYTSDKGIFTINYARNKDTEVTHPFVFNENEQTITINIEAKVFYNLFYEYDPNVEGMEYLYKPLPEKKNDIHYLRERVIDLKKYDLKIIEMNNDLYAPIDLYQVIFKMSFSPTGNSHVMYNGVDYFSNRGSGVTASCYSSELHFELQEPNILMTTVNVTPILSKSSTFSFSPVAPGKGEKHRFESPIIKGGEFTVKATEEIINIPDFYLRIALNNDGTGKYVYINNDTKAEFSDEKSGLIDNKTVTFTEDNDYLHLNVSYPNPFFSDSPMSFNASINKNKTFFLEESRTPEYALYDFNIVSLYLGEFYGLVQSNPKVRDSVRFLEPYKNKILSNDYHDYHMAMSEMALKGIDDGHTKVLGFSKFSKDNFESEENTMALNELTGPRRAGILNYLNLVEGYRKAAGKDKGYEVVEDTAYLAFDEFAATPGKTLDKYTGGANEYVATDTIGFAYTAMKDVSTNHPEVKRVVFDLTCNSGGMVIALPFLVGLMKKEININAFNYYVNELSRRYYQMDLNANGVFGEDDDTYEGKYDFYVLTSNMSFSCGNAFPGIAKYNKAAKIIGKQSAGGASGVDYFTTPSGFDLRCSSCMTEAFMLEDGTFIENDGGIPVDYEISEEYWYDRLVLNQELDKIAK